VAYYRAVCSFFAWLEQHGIGGLVDIEPFHVAAYIKALKVSDAGNPAVKERAAARQPCGTGGEKRDLDDTDRFHYRRRSGRGRRGREFGPAQR
jgi:hypothetical protein